MSHSEVDVLANHHDLVLPRFEQPNLELHICCKLCPHRDGRVQTLNLQKLYKNCLHSRP
jgi:hypothetical protein